MFNLFSKKDAQIQQDVMNELRWDASVSASQISVTAEDGIVTLRGNVPHYYEKTSAEDAAQRVGGVKAVADEIEVKLMGSYERSDTEIASAAASALAWNYSVPDGIKAVVANGRCTLHGEADWDYERKAAVACVEQLMGVRSVINNISLKKRVLSSDIKTQIESAFKRSAEGEGREITVVVSGDHVILSGKLNSYAEIEDAGRAAWNAPGVGLVENNLKLAQ